MPKNHKKLPSLTFIAAKFAGFGGLLLESRWAVAARTIVTQEFSS